MEENGYEIYNDCKNCKRVRCPGPCFDAHPKSKKAIRNASREAKKAYNYA